MHKLKVDLIAAARPNYMKIAPLYHELKRATWCDVSLIDAGQHYDTTMSEVFFTEFGLPCPFVRLGVGSGTHAEQTAGVMLAYEKHCFSSKPDWIVVVGDVNATLSCALVGSKLGIPVAHLEAGLRSRDRTMPEEINRILTDALADILWTSSPDATQNLLAEGLPESRIDFVGNIMIDAFEMQRSRIAADNTRDRVGLLGKKYALVTLHRPSNVDDVTKLAAITAELIKLSKIMPLFFPVHPRTHKRLVEFGLFDSLNKNSSIFLTEPLGYVSFMNMAMGALVVITDSGGIQEETTYAGIPCLTLRDNTERPITVRLGSNRLVQTNDLVKTVIEYKKSLPDKSCKIQYWDGRTASRVAKSLYDHHIKIQGRGNLR